MKRSLFFVVLAFPITITAQAPTRSASVEGDVYLTMQSGDTKKGTGVTVFCYETAQR